MHVQQVFLEDWCSSRGENGLINMQCLAVKLGVKVCVSLDKFPKDLGTAFKVTQGIANEDFLAL